MQPAEERSRYPTTSVTAAGTSHSAVAPAGTSHSAVAPAATSHSAHDGTNQTQPFSLRDIMSEQRKIVSQPQQQR